MFKLARRAMFIICMNPAALASLSGNAKLMTRRAKDMECASGAAEFKDGFRTLRQI